MSESWFFSSDPNPRLSDLAGDYSSDNEDGDGQHKNNESEDGDTKTDDRSGYGDNGWNF